LPDVLPTPQAQLFQRAALGQSELALGVDRKEDHWRLGDNPAQVLLGVA
jgi:hypothetical protein